MQLQQRHACIRWLIRVGLVVIRSTHKNKNKNKNKKKLAFHRPQRLFTSVSMVTLRAPRRRPLHASPRVRSHRTQGRPQVNCARRAALRLYRIDLGEAARRGAFIHVAIEEDASRAGTKTPRSGPVRLNLILISLGSRPPNTLGGWIDGGPE